MDKTFHLIGLLGTPHDLDLPVKRNKKTQSHFFGFCVGVCILSRGEMSGRDTERIDIVTERGSYCDPQRDWPQEIAGGPSLYRQEEKSVVLSDSLGAPLVCRRPPGIEDTALNIMVHTDKGLHHTCLTGCAVTYNNYRRGSRNFVKVKMEQGNKMWISQFQGDFGAIDENQECNDIESQDKQDKTGVDEDQVDKIQYNSERRRSSFSLAKLGKSIHFPSSHYFILQFCTFQLRPLLILWREHGN